MMRSGRTLVSGGAVGADLVSTDAALSCGDSPRCVEVLPCGLDAAVPRDGVCQISVCEPSASFSTGQAMERNALIYSFGRRTVVVRARFRTGGTWHGAVDALRRRLGDVYVRFADDQASAALVRLGAVGVAAASGLVPLLDRPLSPSQPALFGDLGVRSPSASYSGLFAV